MRLGKRPLLLFASSLIVVALAGSAFVYHAASTRAAPTASVASYTGTFGTLSRGGPSATVPNNVQLNQAVVSCYTTSDITPSSACPPNAGGDSSTPLNPTRRAPGPDAPFNHLSGGNTSAGPAAPHGNSSAVDHKGAALVNFNGVTDAGQRTVSHFHVTPPDQALCVGAAGPWETAGLPLGVSPDTTIVWEGVNDAFAIYSTSGAVLFGPDSLVNLFQDPFASGDIGCRYDPATQSYFMVEIGGLLSGPDAGNVGTDLAIVSPNGYTPYGVDTSVGGNCFPDFPQLGFNNDAFYLTINEFCGADQLLAGTNLYAFSKAQLVALDASVNMATFGPLALNGDPVLALQPAIGDFGSTEYLVNSWAYDASGHSITTADTLGLWQVTGDQNITSGSGTVTLTGQSIASETYAFPVPAASTGDGSLFCSPGGNPPPCASGNPITREQFLNPDDSRLEQVQITNTEHGLRLYAALDTALNIAGSSSTVDGAAWFEIDPVGQQVTHQGYVGVAGTSLLYPSLMVSSSKEMVLGFSLTNPTLNPSTGYVFGKASDYKFGAVQVTQVGSGVHQSFGDLFPADPRPRWGDYSAAALDPNGADIWVADEDVAPGPAGLDLVDNWGTQVWEVSGGN